MYLVIIQLIIMIQQKTIDDKTTKIDEKSETTTKIDEKSETTTKIDEKSEIEKSDEYEKLEILKNPETLKEKDYYKYIFAIGDIIDCIEEKTVFFAKNHGAAVASYISNLEYSSINTPLEKKASPYVFGGQTLIQNIPLGNYDGIMFRGNFLLATGSLVNKFKEGLETLSISQYILK